MARIRSVKPEFFTSEQVVECSTNARLLFIGLLCFCDDAGRHPASVKRLKMEVFPGDDCKISTVSGWLDELIANGLIGEYRSQGQSYWYVTGWDKHQKVDRPSVKYPGPFDEGSTIVRGTLALESKTTSRNGVEGKGVESKECSEVGQADSEPEPSPEPAVLAYPCVGEGPSEWPLGPTKLSEYQQSYPGIDALGECRKALQWCRDNPKKRKTFGGMPRFLANWLAHAQDESGKRLARGSERAQPPPGLSQREQRSIEASQRWLDGVSCTNEIESDLSSP